MSRLAENVSKLRDVLSYRKDVVHPSSSLRGTARFVGLEHVESTTGRRLGAVDLELANLTGRKPSFESGDIVYGYLRPYLNKVWLADFDGVCSVDQYVFTPSDGADAEYIAWFLRSPLFLRRAPIDESPGQLPRIRLEEVLSVSLELPPLFEQRVIAKKIRAQFSALATARRALEAQLAAVSSLPAALTKQDTLDSETTEHRLGELVDEVTVGVGDAWRGQPVLGATRAGLAPAKEGVGKQPHRYKPVTAGTVFYNPMRILLGSIALVDAGDAPGITSPDYVVIRGRERVLHPVWFYYWFRSPAGAEFIKTLTRGAVRERLLFNRLAPGRIPVPPWRRQLATVERVRAAEKARQSLAARLKVLEKLPAALLREAFGSDDTSMQFGAVSF